MSEPGKRMNEGMQKVAEVSTATVQQALGEMFTEIMSEVNGYALDRGDSLFETLATIPADEASRPISRQSANLAAQVNHIRFYMDVILQQKQGADWDGSWQVGPVNDAEWQDLIAQKIKDVAREANIAIVENRPLARALYAAAEIGDSVAQEHYKFVAEDWAYGYRLKNKKL